MSVQTEQIAEDSIYNPATVERNEREAGAMIRAGMRHMPEVQLYKKRFEQLKALRRPMESIWKEVISYVMPFSGRFLKSETDDNEDFTVDLSKIRDSMPVKMALTAADGLHGGITNPATQWFSYYIGNYQDFRENISNDAKMWTHNAQECVRDTLASSNFYTQMHPFVMEDLCFATAAMSIVSDPVKRARYHTHTVGSYWIDQNDRMEIDTLYTKTLCRAESIVRKYGKKNCPQKVREAVESNRLDEKFAIITCVQPWSYFARNERHLFYRYEDVRFVEGCSDQDKVLYRRGYRTKPFVVARWETHGDYVYGRSCPAFLALPDIKQLNAMTRDFNMGSKWTSDPAWAVNADLEREIRSIRPGGIYAVRGGDPRQSPITPMFPNAFDFNTNIAGRQALLERINAHLYNREILLVQSRQGVKTATEVAQLQQEKTTVMGPVWTRISYEAVMPILDRTFELITEEWRILPPAPEEIQGQELRPYFTSELAKSQRQADVLNANQALNWLHVVYGLDPQIIHSVNFDSWWRMFGDTDILPPEVIRSRDEVEQRLAADQQAMQQQAQAQQQMQMVDAAQKLGNTSTAPDTALGMMAGVA